MRLFEAIVEANQSATSSDVSLDLEPYADSLPIVALTCVDPRLNRHFPNELGVPEDKFIWLRNAGNIIFDPMSSMTRTLALSVAVKGGKEIAIIGHTGCYVGKVSISELTDRFRAVGVERSRLPDNLNEFFGLFASERQNVIRATEFVRQSPLIGPKVPVHGLLINTETGRLEWVVNGYQTFASTATAAASTTDSLGTRQSTVPLPDFKMGEIKFPEMKIGDVTTPYTPPVSSPTQQSTTPQTPMRESRRVEIRRQAEQAAQVQAQAPAQEQSPLSALGLNLSHMYKVMGDDQKVYGPVLGREIQRWINEGRIDLNTLAQKVGYKNWKRLADFAEEMESHSKTPPTIPFSKDR
jgi:carbonic anhydrase